MWKKFTLHCRVFLYSFILHKSIRLTVIKLKKQSFQFLIVFKVIPFMIKTINEMFGKEILIFKGSSNVFNFIHF